MPISMEDSKRLIEIEAEIARRKQGGRTDAPAMPAPASTLEPAQEGGVARLLATRRAENPIVGLGSQGPPAQMPPHGGTFVPDEAAAPGNADEAQRLGHAGGERRARGGAGGMGTLAGGSGPGSLGEMIGTTLTPGPLKPIAGAIGAGAGEGIRQLGAGEPMDWRKMANEAIWSAAPEVGESVIRHGVKQFARNTPGGILLRHGKAATEARTTPGKIFQPRPADQISDAFEEVKRTNLDIDTGDIRGHLTTLSPGKQADTLNLLTRLDTHNQTGGRYAQLYKDVMSGQNISRSIGDLQDLRSTLRRQAADMDPGEARQMVRDLQQSVDDAIDFGMTHGAMQASTPQIRDTLHTARRDWANRVAADDLGELIEGKISSVPDLSENKFHLSSFVDEIRRGRSEATKSINRSLDLTPGARDRFNVEMKNLSRLFQTVEFSIASDVAGISRFPMVAAVRQGIGQVLLTERGRQWFGDAVTEGRGKLSPNSVAYLVNVARGAFAPGLAEEFPIRPAQPDRESGRAPGGRARSTD